MENIEKKGIFARFYTWITNLTLKGLLGAVLIALIIVIILFSVSFLPNIMSRISSSLSAALYSVFVPAEGATMTVNKTIINSGGDFTVSFKKGDLTDGIFTISYACDSNAELFSVETAGLKKIECNNIYYLLENETAITIRAVTTDNVVRLVIEGSFENNVNQKIEQIGVSRVTVRNDSAGVIENDDIPTADDTTPIIPTTPTTTNTPITPNNPVYVPAPVPVQPYYGQPDLVVRVLQTGLLQTGTNFITNQTQFSNNDMVGIKFEVRNDGDANTGLWYFTASLPSLSTPTYSSNTQISLRPGESIIFTLGFSNLKNVYSNLITINIDPLNAVKESNEINNILSQTITNITYNNNYYNNTNCSNGYYYNGQYYYTGQCDNNNWNNNRDTLSVTCYADPSDPETGDKVRWYADAFGGDGDYDYEWNGTNNLDSSSKNPSKTYSSRGWKYATVTVESDGYSVSQTCSVYVD